MLDSLLRVREKYLKPDGHMFPSHATMLWALVDDEGKNLCVCVCVYVCV